ncbi:MAG TPA: acyl-CoA dehydrogenase family protein [Methylomirabilota bacterium]|jgi:alkylation response protein AidB-like acyl-CoA dehydrogenase|nr:acyl-CoA dehydrogenase family protein [Methylomirabilota bacterium]
MDFAYSASEDAFRAELRGWLEAELPAHRREWPATDDEFTLHPDRAFDACLAWHRRLHKGGWVGIAWPREYGGRGATLVEQMILQEEMVRAGAPPGVNTIGLMMVGPAVMEWGSEEQRRRHLPAILSADEIWCQGFSEPGAGSDLAALRTTAVLEGEVFRVSGQKVWTSNAQRSQWCILLVRTNPAAPKHDGISCLLVDMRSPGITIRPLVQMTGDAEFNEVFFDDVRVPRAHLLGPLDAGWKVAITVLMYERAGLGNQTNLHHFTRLLLDLARRTPRGGAPVSRDPVARQALARCWIEAEALRLTGLRSLTRRLRGEPPGPEGSVLKLAFTDAYAHMAETAAQLLGPHVLLWRGTPRAVDGGRWAFQALFARRFGIAGGTSEIQRNIIGERVLGLPR